MLGRRVVKLRVFISFHIMLIMATSWSISHFPCNNYVADTHPNDIFRLLGQREKVVGRQPWLIKSDTGYWHGKVDRSHLYESYRQIPQEAVVSRPLLTDTLYWTEKVSKRWSSRNVEDETCRKQRSSYGTNVLLTDNMKFERYETRYTNTSLKPCTFGPSCEHNDEERYFHGFSKYAALDRFPIYEDSEDNKDLFVGRNQYREHSDLMFDYSLEENKLGWSLKLDVFLRESSMSHVNFNKWSQEKLEKMNRSWINSTCDKWYKDREGNESLLVGRLPSNPRDLIPCHLYEKSRQMLLVQKDVSDEFSMSNFLEWIQEKLEDDKNFNYMKASPVKNRKISFLYILVANLIMSSRVRQRIHELIKCSKPTELMSLLIKWLRPLWHEIKSTNSKLIAYDNTASMHKSEELSHQQNKDYSWIFDAQWMKFEVADYFCYFGLPFELLASYRPISADEFPASVSPITLSEAGFKYTGKEDLIQCIDCQKIIKINAVTSKPTDQKYHEKDCVRVLREQALSEDVSYHPSASAHTNFDEGFEDSSESNTDHIHGYSGEAPRYTTDSVTFPTELQGATAAATTTFDEDERQHTVSASSNAGATASLSVPALQSHVGEDSGVGRSFQSTSSDSGISSVPSSSGASVSGDFPDDDVFTDDEITDPVEADPVDDSHPPSNGEVLRMDCNKNTGHYAYFPARMLDLQYIPSQCRYQEVLDFLKEASKLVVRVVVDARSPKRPKSDQSRCKLRIGTGSCFELPGEVDSETNQSSKLGSFKKLLKKNKSGSGKIYIETNRHVVYDDFEAEKTTVEFFYDHPNRRDVVKVKGVAVVKHSEPRVRGDNKCILECKTSDLDFVRRINKTRSDLMARLQNFSQPIKEALTKRIFVIAHPHGGEKVLSYGDCVIVKYAVELKRVNGRTRRSLTKVNNNQQVNRENTRKVLLYTADTCQGSSGAPVITFKLRDDTANGRNVPLEMDLWMHNGVDKPHGLGGSVMKVLTPEDVANHGNPQSDRSTFQDNMSRNSGGDGISSFSEVPKCPVFTVFGQPSYPAYVSYDSRWESFVEWNYGHIHDPVTLTEAGFFYAGYADCVRCFQCGLGLRSWKPGDDVYSEHHKHRPTCSYLQMQMRVKGITDPASRQQTRENNTEPRTPSYNSDGASAGGQGKLTMVVQENNVQQPQQRESVVGYVADSIPEPRGAAANPVTQNSEQGNNGAHQPAAAGGNTTNKNLTRTLLERENKILQKQLNCKICQVNPIKDLFLPCGELYACTDCSKLLTHCPSCNKKILATVTTYFT